MKLSSPKPANILLALAIPALVFVYFSTHPFSKEMAGRSINLYGFAPEHRQNFNSALKRLDGAVIQPGQVFSFNSRLGERTVSNGYLPAPGYLGNDRFKTTGGGICLISSTLYQVALLSGLNVIERKPHVKTVASVPPGFDATVWYGLQDLKIKNSFDFPVEISCQVEGEHASIKILGAKKGKELQLERREMASDNRTKLVEVYLKDRDQLKLVSRDSYRIGP